MQVIPKLFFSQRHVSRDYTKIYESIPATIYSYVKRDDSCQSIGKLSCTTASYGIGVLLAELH